MIYQQEGMSVSPEYRDAAALLLINTVWRRGGEQSGKEYGRKESC